MTAGERYWFRQWYRRYLIGCAAGLATSMPVYGLLLGAWMLVNCVAAAVVSVTFGALLGLWLAKSRLSK